MSHRPALSRRDYLLAHLPVLLGLGVSGGAAPADLHRQLLDKANRLQGERRARFAAVKGADDLRALQEELREAFLRVIGGLPEREGVPRVTTTGRIEADTYSVVKLAYESFPGYFVPALLYMPGGGRLPRPAVLSPCGHSTVGKAAEPYQMLHINLAERGYVVLTYDPVGQGERSQFWDAETGRSRFNLTCGEHAVLGNPLYLLGSSLARYRIWDGLRGLDYLASLPEVDAAKIGCVGNSGGGNLTAYLAAIEPRIAAAAICCYITALPRRMANRIEADPDSDPEQDPFGLVGEGVDHAGLLALCAPRPTLLGTARLDFFPIEGARETFEEARRLYEVAGAEGRIARVEAPGRHGLSLPLREAVYAWFDRWLAGKDAPASLPEIEVKPRPAAELLVCEGGQASMAFRSRPLLTRALEEFQAREKTPPKPLRDLLRLDPDGAHPAISRISPGPEGGKDLILCLNGNEAPDWRDGREFLRALAGGPNAVAVVDPRGVGTLRVPLSIRGSEYTDPLAGVEANLAYNAFLLGDSLLGLRVSDAVAAVRTLMAEAKPRRVILCARRDAALVACLAAAVEPSIGGVAAEEMIGSFAPLFAEEGRPINAASILPGLLRDFGDIPEVIAHVAPRKVLLAAPSGPDEGLLSPRNVRLSPAKFSADPGLLTRWIGEGA